MTSTNNTYVLAGGHDEEQRLQAQAASFDPLTQRLFTAAGLAPGMRVLDLGCGAGNVSKIAADMVGPRGSVVGVDSDPAAVERSTRFIAGASNVTIRQADVNNLAQEVDGEFDAVVGRLVLPYVPDAPAVLRQAAQLLRSGGLLCVHEPDMTYDWVSTQTPLWRDVRTWFLDTVARAGVHVDVGKTLFEAFREAGLPAPQMVLDAPIGGGPWSQTYGWANGVVALWPAMQRLGTGPADEAELTDLISRLEEELAERNGSVIGPLMYGAWCRTPAS